MSNRRARDNLEPQEEIDTIVPAPNRANGQPEAGRFRLLQSCLESNDPDSWARLYLLIQETVTPRVRSVLRWYGVSVTETELVLLELIEELYANQCRLRSCRAQNEAEFRAWLWQVATHYTQTWATRRHRTSRKEKAALSRLPLPDRWGSDEEFLRARVGEWQTLMKPKDFERLRRLIGWAPARTAASDRTRRRWEQHLLRQYPHLFGERGS